MELSRVPSLRSKVSMDTLGRRRRKSVSPTKPTGPILHTETRANRHRKDSEEDSPKSSKISSPNSAKTTKRLSTPLSSPGRPAFSTSMSSLFTAPDLKSKASSSKLRTSLVARSSDARIPPDLPFSAPADAEYDTREPNRASIHPAAVSGFSANMLNEAGSQEGKSKVPSDDPSSPSLDAITERIRSITEGINTMVHDASPPRSLNPIKRMLPSISFQSEHRVVLTSPPHSACNLIDDDPHASSTAIASPLRPTAPDFNPQSLKFNNFCRQDAHDPNTTHTYTGLPDSYNLINLSSQIEDLDIDAMLNVQPLSLVNVDPDDLKQNPPLPIEWMSQPYQQYYAALATQPEGISVQFPASVYQQRDLTHRETLRTIVSPPLSSSACYSPYMNSPPAGYSFAEWREFRQAMDERFRLDRHKGQNPVPFGYSARAMFNQPGKKAGFHRKHRHDDNQEPVRCLHCQSISPGLCMCMSRWRAEERCWNCGSPGHVLWQCDTAALTRHGIREATALDNYLQTSHFRQLRLPAALDYKKLAALHAEHETPLDPSYILNCHKCPSHRLDDVLRCLDYVISWQRPAEQESTGKDGVAMDWKGHWNGDFSQCPRYWVLQLSGDTKRFFFIVDPLGRSEIHPYSVV